MKIINFELKILIKKYWIIFKKFGNKMRVHIYDEIEINIVIILPNEKKRIPEIIKMIWKTPA